MRFDEDWDDLFDIRVGPFGMGAFFGPRPFRVRYSRTSDSHLVRLRINKDVKKEELKVRLVEPGIVEIEWPRKAKGELVRKMIFLGALLSRKSTLFHDQRNLFLTFLICYPLSQSENNHPTQSRK